MNLIVFGVGHSGTTVVARKFMAMGWHSLDSDKAYAESRRVRAFSRSAIFKSEPPDISGMTEWLRAQPSPWIIKDPRFLETLGVWLKVFQGLDTLPLLYHVTRPMQALAQSYRRRNELVNGEPGVRGRTVPQLVDLANKGYAQWPGPKIQVSLADVAKSSSIFDGNSLPIPWHHRNDLPSILKAMHLRSLVEVGVNQGRFAAFVLGRWDGLYTGVDPWQTLTDYNDAVNKRNRLKDYNTAVSSLGRFGERVTLMRMTSEQAAPSFDAGSVGAVYLDGNHSKAAVTQDLNTWWPKLQRGGILAGHDYHPRDGWIKTLGGGFECGVRGAVDAFAAAHHLRVHVTDELRYDSQGFCRQAPSFLMVKR